MNENLSNKSLRLSITVVLIAAAFILGTYLGYANRPEISKVTSLFGKEENAPATVDFNAFWKAWSAMDSKFVGTDEEISDQEKVWGAIKGMVASYNDPYTVFMPPQEATMFEEDISGNFSGVGMEVGEKEGVITVIAPLKNTPADKAGIKAGDQIIKIDETVTNGMTVDEAVRLIRGEEGTDVKLTLIPSDGEEPKEVTLKRAVITIPALETELRPDKIFVIKLYSFSAVSPSLFRDALREFINSKTNKLVLDLRGNPGGYLDASIDMASFFLPSGKVVVQEDFGGEKEPRVYRSKGYNIFNDKLKMVILVNEGSASASEILAGALQEQGVAKLVGEKTFGKGSVQELVNITPDTYLKVTVARWLTPNGRSISKEGLAPDYVVPVDEKSEGDPQMEKAVELLLAK